MADGARVPVIVLERQRPELDELDVEQRWRTRCETCGWTSSERYFRERALMDARHHGAAEHGRELA